MVKNSPQKIIAQGTDWRFLNELKRELKATDDDQRGASGWSRLAARPASLSVRAWRSARASRLGRARLPIIGPAPAVRADHRSAAERLALADLRGKVLAPTFIYHHLHRHAARS